MPVKSFCKQRIARRDHGEAQVRTISPFFQAIGLAAVLILFAPLAKADAVYNYAGNAYTSFPGAGYSGSNNVSITLTFANPLAANSSYAWGYGGIGTPTATDTLVSFSFTDGNTTYTSGGINVFLETGSGGQITDWFAGACGACTSSSVNIDTEFGISGYPIAGSDSSSMGSGGTVLAYNSSDPGTWSETPEPSSLLLLGTGLFGLALLVKRLS